MIRARYVMRTSHSIPVCFAILLKSLTFFLEANKKVGVIPCLQRQDAHSVFRLLFCELSIDCPFDLTCLLQKLFTKSSEKCVTGTRRKELTVVPALFTDFLNLRMKSVEVVYLYIKLAYPDQLIDTSYDDTLRLLACSIQVELSHNFVYI